MGLKLPLKVNKTTLVNSICLIVHGPAIKNGSTGGAISNADIMKALFLKFMKMILVNAVPSNFFC